VSTESHSPDACLSDDWVCVFEFFLVRVWPEVFSIRFRLSCHQTGTSGDKRSQFGLTGKY